MKKHFFLAIFSISFLPYLVTAGDESNETFWPHFNGSNNDTDLFVESYFSITCCRGGRPILEQTVTGYARHFEATWAGSLLADRQHNVSCDRYNGKYAVPARITSQVDKEFSSGVRCQCSEPNLDRNCRQFVEECHNGGYRAFSINLRCVCPEAYFGDLCEKYCLNGQLKRNFETGFVESCECRLNFYGDQCEKIVCYNGGVPVNGRGCSCPPFIVGPHCQWRTNNNKLVDFIEQRSKEAASSNNNNLAGRSGVFADAQNQGIVPLSYHATFYKDLAGVIGSLILLILFICFLVFIIVRRKRHRRLQIVVDPSIVETDIINAVTSPSFESTPPVIDFPHSIDNSTEIGAVEMFGPLPTYEQAIKNENTLQLPQYTETQNGSLSCSVDPVTNINESETRTSE